MSNIGQDSEFYTVYEAFTIVGFFCINRWDKELNIIEGFHVLPAYRKRKYLKQYWQEAKELMHGLKTGIGIYEKNEAAIRHLRRNGFTLGEEIYSDGLRHIALGYVPV